MSTHCYFYLAQMNALIAWLKSTRFHMSLSHCLEGFMIFGPILAITRQPFTAALCVVVWYWSGKHYESMTPGDHATSWSAGWFPWQWTRYQFLDVLIPAVWFYFLAWCIEKLIR
nr:MAG TPA: hypothetical protein [Caudoviricetes sp.]